MTDQLRSLVAAGFAIAGLVRPASVAPGQQTEASRVFALYTFARTIPVALVTIAAVLWAPVVVVLWLSALAGLIQLFDGYVGTQLKNPPHDLGPHRHRGAAVRSACVGWSSALPERRILSVFEKVSAILTPGKNRIF